MSIKTESSHAQLERRLIKALILFIAVIVVYIPVMGGGYIHDDDQLLTQNPGIQRGVGFTDPESWRGLWSMWLPLEAKDSSDYAPLASTTLWAEWRLWGNNEPGTPPVFYGIGAPGYHLTNILLHACCAVLLWMVLAQIGIPGAWMAALLWAVHPVCVESVAWISERRNTLSMLLLLVILHVWFKFQKDGRRQDYILAVVLFGVTLLAKVSVVMLPFALLLTAWWMRGKISRSDVKQSIPFFALSFLFGLVTIYFQNYRAIGQEYVPIAGPLGRFTGACFALGFYFYKAMLPFNLILIYPKWHETLPRVVQVLPIFFFIAVFYAAWLKRATWGRHVIFGLGFFVIMVSPTLGFLKMAYLRLTLVADHFEYMPMVGVVTLIVAGLAFYNAQLSATAKFRLRIVAACTVALFCVMSWQRAHVFSKAELLWTDTLKKNANEWQALNHIGVIELGQGKLDEANMHFKRAVELKPYLYEVRNNYGLTLRAKGRMDEALDQFKQAVDINTDQMIVRGNYADTLLTARRFQEAIEQYLILVKVNENPRVYYNMGVALFALGKDDAAIASFQQALRLAPNFIDAKNSLEDVLRKKQGAQPVSVPLNQ